MKVGLTLYVQNYEDWGRHLARERREDVARLEPNTDAIRWAEEIDSVLKIEDQGFDSLWVVEHHVSPYTMITNPVQALTYFAGRTSRLSMGTMIIVMPWHNPVRVAEDITFLQYVMGDRELNIGFGRGLGRREFNALGVDQNTSAARFREGVEIVKLALTEEIFDYQGEAYQFGSVAMRPRPLDPQRLIDDMCFSWGSPTSAPIGAGLGLRPLVIPQKALDEYHVDLEAFDKSRTSAGYESANPRIHLHMYCDADPKKAEAMARKHIPEYVQSAVNNYELTSNHFGGIKGYEHYKDISSVITVEGMSHAWVENCIWGTPEMCIQKLQRLCQAFRPEEFMLTGRYGSMSKADADASIELFAREVMPTIQAVAVEQPFTYAATASA
jgi:alkanesulfonate monooxygenase SsuD/methylene tetrahydromethanopterin reductase-like flavin-dependent oxidoreductase (luciferase family)